MWLEELFGKRNGGLLGDRGSATLNETSSWPYVASLLMMVERVYLKSQEEAPEDSIGRQAVLFLVLSAPTATEKAHNGQ